MKETMKLSRKMQLHVDSRIRHSLATSQPLRIPRIVTTETQPRPGLDNANGNGTGHSK
jgi:hypothetical protein